MIYVTGDMHGDIACFNKRALTKLKKHDYLVVCGDFGFLWDGSRREKRLLKWIGKRRYTVLFVEGTHDNMELLSQYPVTQWQGGAVREISGKLRQLCRGSVFEIDGEKLFAFGGGESDDAAHRLPGRSWWSEELPSVEEIDIARSNLKAAGNAVDYIVTHQCSRRIKSFLAMREHEANILDTFLDEVRENCTYRQWFFGGYHRNKRIPPSEFALFTAVVRAGEGTTPK